MQKVLRLKKQSLMLETPWMKYFHLLRSLWLFMHCVIYSRVLQVKMTELRNRGIKCRWCLNSVLKMQTKHDIWMLNRWASSWHPKYRKSLSDKCTNRVLLLHSWGGNLSFSCQSLYLPPGDWLIKADFVFLYPSTYCIHKKKIILLFFSECLKHQIY